MAARSRRCLRNSTNCSWRRPRHCSKARNSRKACCASARLSRTSGEMVGAGEPEELKIKLAALGGVGPRRPVWRGGWSGLAVGSMWNGPGTPVDEERTARGLSPKVDGSATTPGGPDRADDPSTTPLQHRPKFGGISAPWKTPEHGETSPHVSGTPTSSAVQQPSPGPFQPAGFTYPAIHELEAETDGHPRRAPSHLGGKRRIPPSRQSEFAPHQRTGV